MSSRLMAILAAAVLMGGGAIAPQESGPRVIQITAERFSFTPAEIRIRPDEEVELRLQSEDTDHGFHIAGTAVTASIPKRGKGDVKVKFKPDRAGRYTFECNHVCGAGHDFMRGVLIVEEASDRPGR